MREPEQRNVPPVSVESKLPGYLELFCPDLQPEKGLRAVIIK
jgi:hypothetical protein